MTAYMFPGQGSQVVGMGAELFAKFPNEVNQVNQILGYSIEELCLKDPNDNLSNTRYTQSALYVVEALTFLANGVRPTYCIGHSLGEYSALFAAGAFTFSQGLELVKKRGELMSQVNGGAMLAVINLSADRISQLLQENHLSTIDFANFNSPKQIVLSGLAADITRANQLLSPEAAMCVPLRVSGAFHSRYMENASKEFEEFLKKFEFQDLQTEVISNVAARPYSKDSIKDNLVNQIKCPVRWSETIAYIKQRGESDFKEIGPGTVLSRLMAQN